MGATAVVTGGAAGIGQAIARQLARAGARLIVADVNPAEATLEVIAGEGSAGDYVHCDVASERSVVAFAEAVGRISGGALDILVNNAGVNGECHLLEDMPLERWEQTLRVNLTGTMLVTRELLPLLKANGKGQIVTVASNVSKRGLPFRADYVCSKWAVLGLTQTLALELAPFRIRVNAVCPGPVEGERIEQVMQMHADAEGTTRAAIRRRWAAEAPLGRLVEPTEVAAAVAFLCSDESSALTGQALNVSGGLVMT